MPEAQQQVRLAGCCLVPQCCIMSACVLLQADALCGQQGLPLIWLHWPSRKAWPLAAPNLLACVRPGGRGTALSPRQDRRAPPAITPEAALAPAMASAAEHVRPPRPRPPSAAGCGLCGTKPTPKRQMARASEIACKRRDGGAPRAHASRLRGPLSNGRGAGRYAAQGRPRGGRWVSAASTCPPGRGRGTLSQQNFPPERGTVDALLVSRDDAMCRTSRCRNCRCTMQPSPAARGAS
jgi:hypothetical protein